MNKRELYLKIDFKSLTISNFAYIIRDIDLILKNILDIYEIENEKKLENKSIEIKNIKNGSIEILLGIASFILTADFITSRMAKIMKNIHEFLKELNSSLDEIGKLYSRFSQEKKSNENMKKIKEKLENKQKLLNKKVSLLNHIFEIAKRCEKNNFKILFSESVNENNIGENAIITDKRTYNYLDKFIEKKLISTEPVEICGYIEKMDAKRKPYKVEITIYDQIKLHLYFSSEDIFENLKKYFSPDRKLKVKLEIKLFMDLKNFKRADKGRILKVIGECKS